MRFLILNFSHPKFPSWLYTQHPGLENQPYGEQIRVWNESMYFRADFYSENLRKLGHEAHEIHAENEFLQRAWAREQGLGIEVPKPATLRARRVLLRSRQIAGNSPLRYIQPLFRPLLRWLVRQGSWYYDILAAQIKHYKPDILLNTSVYLISSAFLKTMKPYVGLLVAQIAAGPFCKPLPKSEDSPYYDLIVSSFPPTVQLFCGKGVPAELLRLGFEPRALSHLKEDENIPIPISFVGSVPFMHPSRIRFLENLCTRLDIQVWAPGVEALQRRSAIRKAYMGHAWGLQMYQILARSKITLNHHGDIPPYANNMRLFEATGVGTLLITDWKENLHELFEPGKEVVAYRSAEECAELIQYYLDHEAEREAIARAGQQRTLKDHTYFQRMAELVDIVSTHL